MSENTRKKLYIVLTVAVVFVMLFLLFFITAETNHECKGDDCAICYFVNVAEKIEKTLTVASASVAAGAAVKHVLCEISLFPAEERSPLTLVYLKTKLSN